MLLLRAPLGGKMASDCPTGVVVQPRQTLPLPRTSPALKSYASVNLTYISNSKHWPHLLTAQCAHPGKDAFDSALTIGVFGAAGRQEGVPDSGATFHVTGDMSGMVECEPPPGR